MRLALTATPRLQTAIHEAGHAVAAWRLEIPVSRLTLMQRSPTTGAAGRCYFNGDGARLEHLGAAILAGRLAEQHLIGEIAGDPSSDRDAFAKLCLTDLATRHAERLARRLVSENAKHIWIIGKALSMRGELEDRHLAKVLA